MRARILLATLGLGLTWATQSWTQETPELRNVPLPPQESMSQMVLGKPEQSVLLLAAEPQVQDPVEAQFDDRGRLWVVEMRDYPVQESQQAHGTIRILQDADGDAFFERSTVFATGLEMPTGLFIWKDGAVVTVAGELVFLRDKDQDGQVDHTEQWLTGFQKDNEQLRANHPRLGLDGWWYVACGLRGGEVQIGKDLDTESKSVLRVGSRDVRLNVASGQLEAVTGPAQFGLTFDTLGSRIFCSNRNPAMQALFEQAELSLAGKAASVLPSRVDIIPSGNESHVYPLVDAWTTSNLHAGQFTAACGVLTRALVAQNRLLEEVYACEPTGSLVKMELAKRKSAALELANSSIEPGNEWLASRDPWFRPVNLALAPNGDIAVVDMHRAVIEHPRWVPEELKHRPDQRWGQEAGRLFLIGETPVAELKTMLQELKARPLRSRADSELIGLVASGNPWLRQTASRILLERPAEDSGNALLKLASAPDNNLAGRIIAARLGITLGGSMQRIEGMLLADSTPAELITALLRSLRARERLPSQALLMGLTDHAHDAVLFESLLCLQNYTVSSLPPKVFQRIAQSEDLTLLVACAGALRSHPERFLLSWLEALREHPKSTFKDLESLEMLAKISTAEALENASAANRLQGAIARLPLKENGASYQATLLASWAELQSNAAEFTDLLHPRLEEIAQCLRSDDRPSRIRVLAAECLAATDSEQTNDVLMNSLKSPLSPSLYSGILSAWAESGDVRCESALLNLAEKGTPSQRATAVRLIAQSPNRLEHCVAKIESDPILGRILGPSHLETLQKSARGPVRVRIDRILEQLVNQDRSAVIEHYRSALQLESSMPRGRRIFEKNCATCHRVGDVGVDVGPDISDSRTKSPEQLLTSILDPNRVIDNNYFQVVVLTNDDQIVDGVIADETSAALVILGKEGKRTILDRQEIVEVKSTGVSLMPEGLESQIDVQAMADLIGYLKGWRYEQAEIPGLK